MASIYEWTDEVSVSLRTWTNEQMALHNIRISPRAPLSTYERVKRFYEIYAAKQGISLDEEDAELCAILAKMRHGKAYDASATLDELYQTNVADDVAESAPRSSRQVDIRKCRRSPRLNK